MTETELKKDCIDYLKKHKIWHVRIDGSPRKYKGMMLKCAHAGMPDLVICHKGKTLFCELKLAKGKLQENQQKLLQEYVNAGGKACIVRSLSGLIKALENADADSAIIEEMS